MHLPCSQAGAAMRLIELTEKSRPYAGRGKTSGDPRSVTKFAWLRPLVFGGTVALLAGCASVAPEWRGELTKGASTKTASLSPAALTAALGQFEEGKWINSHAGALNCGVDVHHYQYSTVDGKGQRTTASSALMVPTGPSPKCSGARPVIVALHGTMPDRRYNLADLSGKNAASGRALAWAGTYAAQGYIVVAPNYAGFDTSSLSYHPYHDGDQQSKDVIDALASARALLPAVGSRASDKVFLVGYSQGGYVAMATHRAMQAAGIPVTASMPSSGAYPIGVLADDLFMGRPVNGSPIYIAMVIRAYQEAYGNIYRNPSEIYTEQYATDLPTLLPSNTPTGTLIKEGKVPLNALFSSTPPTGSSPQAQAELAAMTPATEPKAFAGLYASGFGPKPTVNNAYRLAYIQDVLAHPDGATPKYTNGQPASGSTVALRQAFIKNDLRGWTPRTPVVMCGGSGDEAVPFRLGAQLMMQYWSDPATAAPAGMASVLNFEEPAKAGEPYADLKQNFASMKAQILAGGGSLVGGFYHAGLLPRYCYTAARTLFDSML